MAPDAEIVHLRDELETISRHSAINSVLELNACVVDGVICLPNEEVIDVEYESVNCLFEFLGSRPIVFSLRPLRVLSVAPGGARHCQSLGVEAVVPDVRYD